MFDHHMLTAGTWDAITDFGDSSVTLSIAVFILIYLLSLERWRAAIAWLMAIASCGVGMALLKIAFRSCAQGLASADFVSASGHSAMSATVYGGFALLLAARPQVWQRLLPVMVAALLILAIAVSRVVLGAHRTPEVIAGLLIGLVSVLLFHRAQGKERRPIPLIGPVLGAMALILLMHGQRWPVEDLLIRIASWVRQTVPACA